MPFVSIALIKVFCCVGSLPPEKLFAPKPGIIKTPVCGIVARSDGSILSHA